MNGVDELLEKCRAATEGSRELDRLIAEHVAGLRFRTGKRGREWFIDSHGGVEEWARQPPAYTGPGVDAILSLIEAKLPGWGIQMYAAPESSAVCLSPRLGAEVWGDVCKTLPLAILCAFLSAIRSTKPGDDHDQKQPTETHNV